MGVTVFLRGKFTQKDSIILKIASELFKELGDIVKGVQRAKSWDGSNLKIIVKEDTPETIEKVMKTVYRILEKNNAIGEIIPEIVKEDELLYVSEVELPSPSPKLVEKIKNNLLKNLPEIVVDVKPTRSWDGSNLKIIVKEDTPETIEKVMKTVYRILEKNNAIGEIIPEIVKENDNRES